MSSCALKALEGGGAGDNLSGALMQVRCERLDSDWESAASWEGRAGKVKTQLTLLLGSIA